MPRRDFEMLSPEEFAAVCKAYSQEKEAESRERWEQTRILAAIAIQPHLKKKVTARQLLPLPWDKGKDLETDKRIPTKEEQRRRLRELARRG